MRSVAETTAETFPIIMSEYSARTWLWLSRSKLKTAKRPATALVWDQTPRPTAPSD
jgi:hypothetical protein